MLRDMIQNTWEKCAGTKELVAAHEAGATKKIADRAANAIKGSTDRDTHAKAFNQVVKAHYAGVHANAAAGLPQPSFGHKGWNEDTFPSNKRAGMSTADKKALAGAGLIAGGVGGVLGLGALANYADIHLRKIGIQDARGRGVVARHPYMASLGTQAAIGAGAAQPALVIPAAIGNSYMSGRTGREAYTNLKKDRGGPFAQYTERHPYLGSAASALTFTTPNTGIAGEVLAQQSKRNKDFTYRHPYGSAYLHQFMPIPGVGAAYNQAAARILAERRSQ